MSKDSVKVEQGSGKASNKGFNGREAEMLQEISFVESPTDAAGFILRKVEQRDWSILRLAIPLLSDYYAPDWRLVFLTAMKKDSDAIRLLKSEVIDKADEKEIKAPGLFTLKVLMSALEGDSLATKNALMSSSGGVLESGDIVYPLIRKECVNLKGVLSKKSGKERVSYLKRFVAKVSTAETVKYSGALILLKKIKIDERFAKAVLSKMGDAEQLQLITSNTLNNGINNSFFDGQDGGIERQLIEDAMLRVRKDMVNSGTSAAGILSDGASNASVGSSGGGDNTSGATGKLSSILSKFKEAATSVAKALTPNRKKKGPLSFANPIYEGEIPVDNGGPAEGLGGGGGADSEEVTGDMKSPLILSSANAVVEKGKGKGHLSY